MSRSKKDIIESNLKKIEKWTAKGLTIKQMAKNLGVSERTLYRYKNDSDSHLSQTIKNGRAVAVEELENTMMTSACGYTRKVKKHVKVKRIEYENGKKLLEYEDMVEYEEEVYYPPDTTAGIFLLKNWGNYMNEPRAMEIRKKELELREQQIKANNWMLEE
jgi:transcriptional regulator with XRE-family HTH domain